MSPTLLTLTGLNGCGLTRGLCDDESLEPIGQVSFKMKGFKIMFECLGPVYSTAYP